VIAILAIAAKAFPGHFCAVGFVDVCVSLWRAPIQIRHRPVSLPNQVTMQPEDCDYLKLIFAVCSLADTTSTAKMPNNEKDFVVP